MCMDSNEKRLPRLNENLERCGVKIAEVSCHDWTEAPPEELLEACDAILLDVPCSNTGVFRRRVDARWRIQKIDLEKLLVIQNQILEQAIKCLKPGGRLVYSTCSIDPEENTELVNRFLKRHPDFLLEKSDQLLPFKDGSDGAFAALLRQNSSS
ncbi:MAG TPA: hypothetical protein DDY45_08225 [Verrucomicrobiales bacterium]|nr:hypothetical protein [Verrucomicrobiales bacterium]